MRSPRSSPLEIVARNDALPPRSEASQDSASADDTQPPAWDNYFYIAPNVRFTRTPDRMLRRNSEEKAAQQQPAQQTTSPARPPFAPAPAPARTMMPVAPAQPVQDVSEEPQAALVAPAPIPSPAPAPVQPQAQVVRPAAAVHANPAYVPPSQPMRPVQHVQPAPRPAVPVVQTEAPAPQPAAAAPVVRQVATSQSVQQPMVQQPQAQQPAAPAWSYLSDFAFFELAGPAVGVSTDEPEAIVPPAMVAQAAPVVVQAPLPPQEPAPTPAARVVPMQPVDIASLYRVIECAVAQTPSAPKQEEVHQPDAVQQGEPEVVPVVAEAPAPAPEPVRAAPAPVAPMTRAPSLPMAGPVSAAHSRDDYEFPPAEFLQLPPEGQGFYMSQERLEQNADLLESVLQDFGVRGEIIHVHPGPVVTLYEFEPAPGVKSSRVIGLAEDIARSMSAISARVAVVPGRNVIGIELPNESRETVYLRELIECEGFRDSSYKLAVCLGKTIGGDPVIAELAKMPHLLVAGTTGSGKSVAINTMILSLLYRLKPEECRLIMVDPKMLELSVYDGIPHLLTPVVTDPKKAVTALKWAVREMEDRYRKMARLGVRNIDGFNQRAKIAREKGEVVTMQVQTGFEKGTGEPVYEDQEIDLTPMPYIVVIVDEMADLMMVAGKEIEGAIQRLAQMARAAGIHLIMATQRPSVDVITGTIKANFPTRISFQVTSKIDSRTILGEQGAEQLLGQGDMLHTAGGGRISRVHGPFVSDEEVERVVAHLKLQGRPEYLDTVTADEDEEIEEEEDAPVFDKSAMGSEDGDDLFDEAVKVVLRDKKCSTSYIQRRLGIGYNRAASLVERMEKEGLVGAPNHVGKREILVGKRDVKAANDVD